MTLQEFDSLKEGDHIDGRNYGDGVVERKGESLFIRWLSDGCVSWEFSILRTLWGDFDASPMRWWYPIPKPKNNG